MDNYKPLDILLVEDDPHDAELTIRSLKREHLAKSIFHVDDGKKALDYIFCRGEFKDTGKYQKPKVIFLDLKLPKVHGLEVLEQLKEDPDKKKLPVVILTSSREESDLQKAYELGANSYVVKPVDFGAFQQTIKRTGVFWLEVNEIPA